MVSEVQGFFGRTAQLRELAGELSQAGRGRGRFVTVRGRRQVGKSWLISEFLERYAGPSLFFDAHGYTETRELERFREALAASSLPSAHLASKVAYGDWEGALIAAAAEATPESPSVIVIDEFPELCRRRRVGEASPPEGSIRAAWRTLEQRPVLLILIGSDLAMMERLTTYGAPLYQRPTREMVIPPLSPLEAARLSGQSGADALDRYLVTGGFPRLVGQWSGGSLEDYLATTLAEPESDLVRIGSRILEAELPSNVNARSVLSVIGAGERTNSGLASRTGIASNNLTAPSGPLPVLTAKRIVTSSLPLSMRGSTDRRYAILDPYLRFWLAFIEPNLGEIERGLGATLAPRLAEAFATFRGLAIEPIVRQALERLSIGGDATFDGARAVGAFWTRDNTVEVDLVGADHDRPPVESVAFVGTVKWREAGPVDGSDIAALVRDATSIAGTSAATRLVAVSRSGFKRQIAAPVRRVEADEVLEAFPAD